MSIPYQDPYEGDILLYRKSTSTGVAVDYVLLSLTDVNNRFEVVTPIIRHLDGEPQLTFLSTKVGRVFSKLDI